MHTSTLSNAALRTAATREERKLHGVGFPPGFRGILAGEQAHAGFPRGIPLDSRAGFL